MLISRVWDSVVELTTNDFIVSEINNVLLLRFKIHFYIDYEKIVLFDG